MKQYSTFSAFFRAPLFQRDFYQDVALRWRGIGFWYLVLLLMLSWLVVMIPANISLSNFVERDAAAGLKDFPPIDIKAGHASSPVPQPYIVHDDAGSPIFVLDTTGSTKRPRDLGARMLLTENELIQEEPGGALKTNPLATFPDMSVDKNVILSWFKVARTLFIPVGLPIMVVLSLLFRLPCMLVLAAIGVPIANSQRAGLSYGALLRLTSVSFTAPLILYTIWWFIPLNLGCFVAIAMHLAILGFAFVYLLFGIKAAAELFRGQPAFPVQPPVSSSTIPPPVDSNADTNFP
jgi:hypothetical protein